MSFDDVTADRLRVESARRRMSVSELIRLRMVEMDAAVASTLRGVEAPAPLGVSAGAGESSSGLSPQAGAPGAASHFHPDPKRA